VPLHKVTSAEHKKLDDEIVDGRVHKGRVLSLEEYPLTMPGLRMQSTINLLLYFTPDLPPEVMLEEKAESHSQVLDDEYMARLKGFYTSLPGRVRNQMEQSMVLEFARGQDFELGWEQYKRLVSAEDQDGIEHFFCEYLCAQQPPSSMTEPLQVARMVRCITWEIDTEIFKKETRKDVWQTPLFFMEMRKGDFEDHALLMCNLFLGLGLDAYVCVGRLADTSEGEKRHVWVMTREPGGDVSMWETSQGLSLTLLDRWQGVQLSAPEKAALEAAKGSSTVKDADHKPNAFSRFRRKAAAKISEAVADAPPEQDMPRPDDPSQLAELEAAGGIDAHLLSAADEFRENFAQDDTLNRLEVEESLNEVLWLAGDDDDDGAAEAKKEAEAAKSAEKEELANLRRAADAEQEYNEDDLERELGYMPPSPPLLYAQLECVFNQENLWVSRLSLDPKLIKYDFDEPKYWTAFVEPRMASSGRPTAFYTPQRLSAKTPNDRLRSMEAQILGELVSQLKMARPAGLPTTINKSSELVATLQRGLELQEASRTGDKQAEADIVTWRRDVKTRLPVGSTFKARAFHYSYTDAKKIRRNLLASVDYAEDTGDGTEYALAVKVFGFHGGICSVWVYYGLIDTDLLG